MNGFMKRAFLITVAGLIVPNGAHPQSPAGPPLLVWAAQPRHQLINNVVVRPDGSILVLWFDTPRIGDDGGQHRLSLRGFTVEDEALGPPFSVASSHGTGCCGGGGGSIAGNEAGHLVVTFSKWRVQARRYGFAEGPRALRLDTSETFYSKTPTSIALDARGNFVVVWESQSQEVPDREDSRWGVFGRLVDFRGNPVGPEFHVNTVRRRNQDLPRVSMSARTGAFVVVWNSDPTGSDARVAGQLFAPGGDRVGGEFRVGSIVSGAWLAHPRVAMAPDGTFVVVWQEPDSENPGSYVILGQRFSAAGQPTGPRLRVSEGLVGLQEFPRITMDARGNFLIAWNEDQFRGTTMAQLYRANGVPVGKPIALVRGGAAVTFGWNGTFAAAWTEPFPFGEGERSFARRFSASPGDELCLFREGELACDTGRTGGVAEVRHPFGVAGDAGLLGDVDGDGRADPCVFREGRFLCDIGHDYGSAEAKVRFGQDGDVPLLGDVDGDGRADPCVYRAGKLLCDAAHDGGAAELEVASQAGGVPLLGDLGNKGRAGLCLFRAGRFLCDTNLDGTLEVDLSFGRPGDVPLLMDYDADGTVEPCVYRGRELLCDTGHDGGAAEAVLVFGEGKGTPLVGNLDGL